MPTERFYRLPEAKKQVIRQAAIKEFARVPFEKASICLLYTSRCV